jgi:dTDP-4-amino-4,6-dideoxygalactose transaminase
MKVPFIDLTRQHAILADEITRAVGDVVSGAQFILGPAVEAFEAEFAAYCGVRHAVGMASGTDALRLALEAADVGPGDEVIVPAFTFVATATMVSQLGAQPVFADIDPHTWTLDAADVERRITERTRALIPVHLYGQPAAMGPLLDVAGPKKIVVIEDAAQAVGATWQGRRAGGLGQLGCFSFYPTKNLGAIGDAGLVTTNDAELAERLRRLRHHGSRLRYVHDSLGWCSRLDEIQAAVLRVKLRRLDAWTAERRMLAARYRELLAGLPITLPVEAPNTTAVYHLFTIRTPARDALKAFLEDRGVGSAVHYPIPLHLQPLYRKRSAAALPESERAAEEVLSLPLYPELRAEELEVVAAVVREFFEA